MLSESRSSNAWKRADRGLHRGEIDHRGAKCDAESDAANGADSGGLTNGPNRIELDGHDGIEVVQHDGVQYDGSGVESDDFDVVRCDRNSENAAKHQIANQHVEIDRTENPRTHERYREMKLRNSPTRFSNCEK